MTFLSKFGAAVAKGLQIVFGVGPLLTQLYPKAGPVVGVVESELGQLAGVIQTVEVIGQRLQLPGTAKLTGAAPLVAQVILQSSIMANHQIAKGHEDAFNKAVTGIASNMADLLNSLEDKVVTQDKTQ